MSEIMEWHQITFDEYLTAKQEIRNRLMSTSENFVVIGYRLRQIEVTKSYEQEGYTSLKEFAKAEFNLSESSVSRFMAINKRFSIDGNSDKLLPEYKEYGYSKLQEMLTLTEEDMELVTETTTIAQIRDIKQFEREEKQLRQEEQQAAEREVVQEESVETVEAEVVSETQPLPAIDVKPSYEIECDLAPSEDKAITYNWNDLQKVIIEMFRDEKERLTEIYGMSNIEDIVERINPSGNKTFKYKIYMLFMYGYSEGVTLRQMGKGNSKYTWEEFIAAAVKVYSTTYTDPDSVWDNFYGVTSTKKENMHVSEEKKAEDKIEQDREKSRDTAFDPAKTIYNKPDERVEPQKKPENVPKPEMVENTENELPGQMNIENYPEALPDGFATSQDREKSTKTDILDDEKKGKLTWCLSDGSWGLKNGYPLKDIPQELYGAIYKLMKYERTNLSPEEIEDMINEKHYTEE